MPQHSDLWRKIFSCFLSHRWIDAQILQSILRGLHTGGLVGGFFATNVGHFKPLGIDGWRFAFYFVAIISLVVSGLVLKFAADPRKKVITFFLFFHNKNLSWFPECFFQDPKDRNVTLSLFCVIENNLSSVKLF